MVTKSRSRYQTKSNVTFRNLFIKISKFGYLVLKLLIKSYSQGPMAMLLAVYLLIKKTIIIFSVDLDQVRLSRVRVAKRLVRRVRSYRTLERRTWSKSNFHTDPCSFHMSYWVIRNKNFLPFAEMLFQTAVYQTQDGRTRALWQDDQ
jgi:hypothetical protein